MATTPDTSSQYVFGPAGSGDTLHFKDSAGAIVSWIDSKGFPQGNLATSTILSFVGVPTGNCTVTQAAVNTGTGDFYSCSNSAWVKIGPTAGSLVSPVTSPNPLAFDVNTAFKGPNPYIDATRFGVRAVIPSVVPAIPGITVNCTSGSSSVTISAASTFQNGDGVALYGCGAGTVGVPAAPTVTPSLAAAQTGLLLDVNGPTGSTTYCYQLVARTLLGAINVSSQTCTTTGPASLGLQTNTITSATLSNTTATYLTSAPHGLVIGAHIVVKGMGTLIAGSGPGGQANQIPFNGWFTVATVPDNTHFTVNLMTDTRNGAIAAGTGGTVNYWNSIRITAAETTNNFQYYIYGRVSGGTKTLIGTMWPQNSGGGFAGDPTYLAFQDFGSTVTTFPNPPSYIPTTVPATPTNEMLSTTIVSGAGTTSLVLANNAGNTISGQTILFDDAVTISTAAAYAVNNAGGTNGPLMLPEAGNQQLYYVFNSPISLGTGPTSGLTILQKGQVWINEPITLSGVNWLGQPTSHMGPGAFGFDGAARVTVNKASPGLYATFNNQFYNLSIGTTNTGGTTLYVQDYGGIPAAGVFDNVYFSLGSSCPIFSNTGAVIRGGAGFFFRNTTLAGSQNFCVNGQFEDLTATTPGIYFNLTGNVVFDNLTLVGPGIATRVNAAGGFMKADAVYSQGNYQPYFSFVNSGSPFLADIRNVIFDTTSVPLVANYGGTFLSLELNSSFPQSNDAVVTGSFPPGSAPRTNVIMNGSIQGTGTPQNLAVSMLNESYSVNDGVFGRAYVGLDRIDKSISIGLGYSLFSTTGFYPSPTCPVSAGGSVPIGDQVYTFRPLFPNGSEGTPSTTCIATTSSGNQTVTLNWASVTGVTQYWVYRNGVSISCSPTTGTTLVDTVASPCGLVAPAIAAGGPAGMQGSLVWAQKMQIGDRANVTSGAGAPPGGLCTTSTGGKLYLRTDGTTTTTFYVCDGATGTWTAK